jgi:CRP-like cAMP-binding protein
MDPSSLGKVSQILESLDAEGRKRFLALAKKRHVEKGAAIFREGEEGDEFFVIARGRVRVSAADLDAGEKELAVLEHGSFFGEIAILGGHTRSATVVALEDTELVAFQGPGVHALLKGYPAALEALSRVGLIRAELTMEKLST